MATRMLTSSSKLRDFARFCLRSISCPQVRVRAALPPSERIRTCPDPHQKLAERSASELTPKLVEAVETLAPKVVEAVGALEEKAGRRAAQFFRGGSWRNSAVLPGCRSLSPRGRGQTGVLSGPRGGGAAPARPGEHRRPDPGPPVLLIISATAADYSSVWLRFEARSVLAAVAWGEKVPAEQQVTQEHAARSEGGAVRCRDAGGGHLRQPPAIGAHASGRS